MTKSYEYKDILNRLSDMQRVPYYAAACHDLVKAEMAIVALENERDALRTRLAEVEKDALRYQAIRNGLEVDPDNSGIVVSLIDNFGGETLHGDKADAAIDAVLKAELAIRIGWKLVPLEPTEAMLQADVETDAFIGVDDARKLYSAMIAAAPGAKL